MDHAKLVPPLGIVPSLHKLTSTSYMVHGRRAQLKLEGKLTK